MKRYEKNLLDNLELQKLPNDTPLKNIKDALGSIAYMVGNPLTKTEITLEVTTTFLDAGGGGVILPAALPLAAQTSVPVYVFGLTDFYSGFPRLINLVPISPPWVIANPAGPLNPAVGIFGFNVFFSVNPNAQLGDQIIWLFAAGAGPGGPFWCQVTVHCTNVAYGTLLNSFVSDLITIDTIRYILPIANINQFINPILFATQTLFGKVKSDNVDPRMFIKPKDFQQQISDIPINLPIDKTLMIGLQLDVFCQFFSWVLFVKKVEPLTHKL